MLKLIVGGAKHGAIAALCKGWISERMPHLIIAGSADSTEHILKAAFDNDKSSSFVFLLSEDIGADKMDLFMLSTQLRSTFPHCAMLFLHDDAAFLTKLVNANIMPSGFLPVNYRERELYMLLTNVYEQYMRSLTKLVFTAYTRGVYHNIPHHEIEYIEAAQKKVRIVTSGGCVEYADTLQNLERKLDAGFLRCHNSFIINAAKIRSVGAKAGYIDLYSGARINISGKYQDKVEQYMKKRETAGM